MERVFAKQGAAYAPPTIRGVAVSNCAQPLGWRTRFLGTAMSHPSVIGPVRWPTLPPSFEQFLVPELQPVPLLPALALILAAVYLAGAIRMWARGYRWPMIRTVCFLFGCLLLFAVTGLGVEGYGFGMFSVFMFQQLTLMMVVAPLLVLGSPGTLLLRATPHRGVGRSVLRFALCGLRSRAAGFAMHPALVIPLMLLCFFGLYLGGVANVLLRTWTGHIFLEVVFLVVGILITAPLISSDPLPRRRSYVSRLFDVFIEMQVHAMFGLVMLLSTTPLVAFFVTAAPEAWGVDPVRDQGIAGILAWTYGELPLVIILIVTLGRWHRQDTTRAAKAQSRSDAETDTYNEYLKRLQEQNVDATANPKA